MSLFYARQLLLNAAIEFQHGRQSFSRDQISKKINEIKYLSTQKKVPRVSLRKEIAHLEFLLHGVMELDKNLAQQKHQDSAKVTALKRQISQLKHKLVAASDKSLPHKVEKLSHVLGDYMARKDTTEEIVAAAISSPSASSSSQTYDPQRLESLRQRLEALKQELEIMKHLESKDPSKIDLIQAKIGLLEQKLFSISGSSLSFPQLPSQDITHRMIFTPTGKPLKEELLPPPQPMRKK